MTRSSTFLGNNCFTLFIWQSEDIRDDVKLATCSLNVKPESKSIPTSLHDATGFNSGGWEGASKKGTCYKW